MDTGACLCNQAVAIFLCGDVMAGRGIDQILPFPSNPTLHEPYARSALEYVARAEDANGPIEKPVDFRYVWGDAADELKLVQPSIRIVNLETSVTTNEDYEPKGIHYRMHPLNIPCLTAAGVDCCTLANNHVMDWGRCGLIETLDTIQHAGIRIAGAGRNLEEALQPAIAEIANHARVLVFAVATADSGIPRDWTATESEPGIALLPNLSIDTATWIAKRMLSARRARDVIVLSIHWGGNWGYKIPPEQRDFAHALVDTGAADIIHGHSSHHPKGIEVYRCKPILYGCGDFINDYEGISGQEEFRSQLVLMYFVAVNPSTGNLIRLEMTPLEMRRMQLHHVRLSEAKWLRDLLNREGECLGTRAILHGRHLQLQWHG